MNVEDLVLEVIEQQVQDWCNAHNWAIKARTESSIRMEDQLQVTLKYDVVIPGSFFKTDEPVEQVLHISTYNDDELGTAIVGVLMHNRDGEEDVFHIQIDQIEIETTGPYTAW